MSGRPGRPRFCPTSLITPIAVRLEPKAMRLPDTAPIIAVPMCVKRIDGQDFHTVGEKYLTAIIEGAEAYPLSFPALGPVLDPAFATFVGRREIAQAHGMTVAELALFFKAE